MVHSNHSTLYQCLDPYQEGPLVGIGGCLLKKTTLDRCRYLERGHFLEAVGR